MHEIQIQRLMSKKVITVKPEASVKELIQMMHKRNDRCVVVTEGEKPIGIITERDIVGILAELIDHPGLISRSASEVMSTPPVVINHNASFFDATIISKRWKIRHLPVVDPKRNLVGLITQSEISRARMMVIEEEQEILKSYLRSHRQKLKKASEDLKMLALKDDLLGIGNRRAMERDLRYTHESAKRYQRPYSLVLFNIDYFKKYNERYGQVAGDKALKQVAYHIKKSIREADRLYRYSGEAFLLLLPETTGEQANAMADRLVHSLSDLGIPHCENPFKVLTMSGGVSSREGDKAEDHCWNKRIAKAERGLYQAKQKGRNQVVSDSLIPTAKEPAQDWVYSKACNLYAVSRES